VEERAVESLRAYPKKPIRPDISLYIQPSQTARQRDWVALTADTFAPLAPLVYSNYQKRAKDSGLIEIEVFVLPAKKERRTLPGTRRATASRIHKIQLVSMAKHLDVMLAEEKLPNYNLLSSGVFSSFVPPQEPDEDVEDLDHANDKRSITFDL
ncbi:hypothetical protein GN958_ATG04060, partial [Phytophthora infestans]